MCAGLWRFCAQRARPRAQRVLTPRLVQANALPTPRRDVNGPGHGQRGTEAPSNGRPFALTNPDHTLFVNPQPQGVHCPVNVLWLGGHRGPLSLVPRNCQSASGVVKTHGPPISTVHTSVLARTGCMPMLELCCAALSRGAPVGSVKAFVLAGGPRARTGVVPRHRLLLCGPYM